MTDRDIRSVRLVGSFAVISGFILLALSILTALFTLFSVSTTDLGQFAQGGIALMVAIIMASVLMSCGTHLARVRLHTSFDTEALALNWTALFAVMLIGGFANLWLIPQLTILGAIVALALLLVRSAIIRLTGR